MRRLVWPAIIDSSCYIVVWNNLTLLRNQTFSALKPPFDISGCVRSAFEPQNLSPRPPAPPALIMASTKLVALLFALPILYYANQLFKLRQNYLAARRTGLPVLVNPLSIGSLEWIFGKKLIIAILLVEPVFP